MAAKLFLLALVALVAFAVGVDAQVKTIPNYKQCGGKGADCAQYKCVDSPFPNTKCAGGGTCTRQNEFYWQCLGGSATAPTKKATTKKATTKKATTKVATTKKATTKKATTKKATTKKATTKKATTKAAVPTKKATVKTLPKYAQCGGKGGDCATYTCVDGPFPNTKCAAGSTCQRQSEWYRQCL